MICGKKLCSVPNDGGSQRRFLEEGRGEEILSQPMHCLERSVWFLPLPLVGVSGVEGFQIPYEERGRREGPFSDMRREEGPLPSISSEKL